MRDCHSSDDKDVIAIDGKTLRHSYDKSRRRGAIHVISAFSTMHSLVLGQIKTDEKSNEITAIPELLNMMDIKGKIITTDAMGCQKDIAEKIQKQGGDYLFAVKGNQGRLNKAFEEKFPLKELNNPEHDSYAISEKSHGREEIRLHIVCDVPDELIDFTFEWKGYDPLGRRMAKRVWRRERDLTGWMSLSRKPEMTWYGWDGDRLTTVQTDTTRIQTVYQPGSFAPLIRIETDNGEREKAQRRSLAEKLQQEGSEDGHGVVFPAELVRLLDRLEEEIRADRVSSESRAWLAQCGLTVEQLARQVEPEYTPARKAHLYHCDHRGLPLALISEDGNTAWSAEYDEWGNQLNEENPHHVYQPYRLPGQQHDEESGLYYNRHRYYDPLQGRYITQDPMGLKGGWNLYQYPLNPLQQIDPMGLLQTWDDARSGACTGGVCGVLSRIIGPSKFDSTADAALDALKETQNRSLCNDMEYSGIVCKDTNGKYFASKAETDNLRKESYPLKRKCPTGTDRVAAYHTHGADSHGDYVDEFFSSSDKNLVRSKDNNLEAFYLATPDGRFEALNNKGEYIFIRNSVPGLSSVCIPYHD
ncbi:RhsD protein [Escherichia coli]|nr:RhsD protein [Escherichia coli]